jgi:predicted DNA-binding ribbon-helix-helix protein
MSLTKRSISLDGHATSVALEPEFWAVLDSCARANSQSLASLIGSIDTGRGTTPLASALRVWALGRASEGVGLR